jgi:hypothetical protein
MSSFRDETAKNINILEPPTTEGYSDDFSDDVPDKEIKKRETYL